MRNLRNPPSGSTKDNGLSRLAFEDHLFIEFAEARRLFGSRKINTIETTIRNRSSVHNRNPLRRLSRRETIGYAIPRNARTQLRKLIRGITPRKQVEHVLERFM